MEELMIETKNLSCKSGYRYLLKDIDWQVKSGEHWVVFGMNGSGKTTLLSIIAGFKKFTHGELTVLGEAYRDDNILDMRKRIGFVSSSFFDRYYTKESALDIVLSGKFGRMGLEFGVEDQDVAQAKRLLSELHLADKINQPFSMMSRGERQNVLIARALLFKPDILLLDEPCTGLDIMARAHLLDTVRDLAENTDVTIVYVTHYTEEILDIFPKVLCLKQGHVYTQGNVEEVFTTEKMSDFLGYPVTVNWQDDGCFDMKVDVCSGVRKLLQGSVNQP